MQKYVRCALWSATGLMQSYYTSWNESWMRIGRGCYWHGACMYVVRTGKMTESAWMLTTRYWDDMVSVEGIEIRCGFSVPISTCPQVALILVQIPSKLGTISTADNLERYISSW
jgi:hypothetical protein